MTQPGDISGLWIIGLLAFVLLSLLMGIAVARVERDRLRDGVKSALGLDVPDRPSVRTFRRGAPASSPNYVHIRIAGPRDANLDREHGAFFPRYDDEEYDDDVDGDEDDEDATDPDEDNTCSTVRAGKYCPEHSRN